MNGRTKKLMSRIAVLCLIAFLVCTAYLIAEADHECAGEECRICETLDALLTRGKEVTACPELAGTGQTVAALLTFCAGLLVIPVLQDTPVINKIRIDC